MVFFRITSFLKLSLNTLMRTAWLTKTTHLPKSTSQSLQLLKLKIKANLFLMKKFLLDS